MKIHDLHELKNIPVDYDSPITLITNEIANSISARVDEEAHKLIAKTALAFNIDEQKMIEALKQDVERYHEAYKQGYKKRDAEIVRCKDCKHYHEKPGCCDLLQKPIGKSNEWFCADGERKE